MDHVEEPEAVLLVVEEVVADDAKGRRDRDHQAILPVPDLADAEAVDGLRTAMGFPGAPDDPAASRYHRVCIVAFPASPVRSWVAAFFAAEVPWLVEGGRLSWCLPPFDRRHTTQIPAGDGPALAEQWERLRPDEPVRAASRRRSGGWWGGPEVAVRTGEAAIAHLRVGEGRRSYCGLRAKDLERPDPPVGPEDLPAERRCPACTQIWLDETRAGREDDRRRLQGRLEAVAGLLDSSDHLGAIGWAVVAAADRPAAHAALTGEPYSYSDLQAFHILNLPAGQRTAEGRADLEAQQAELQSEIDDLDRFLAGP